MGPKPKRLEVIRLRINRKVTLVTPSTNIMEFFLKEKCLRFKLPLSVLNLKIRLTIKRKKGWLRVNDGHYTVPDFIEFRVGVGPDIN